MTGLTDALMDSIPGDLRLIGQVPNFLIGNDAFQEADTTGITRPCTKHNYLVKSIEDLPRIMHEAFYVAPPMAAPARWWSTFRRTCGGQGQILRAASRTAVHRSYQRQVKADRTPRSKKPST